MKKEITITQFADELMKRIDDAKTIDCCKDELKSLANIAKDKIGNEKITVNWKD